MFRRIILTYDISTLINLKNMSKELKVEKRYRWHKLLGIGSCLKSVIISKLLLTFQIFNFIEQIIYYKLL